MDLATDDFQLFGLPRGFGLDRAELDARRRALQAEVHPDRFVAADAAARRAAMQMAVRVNEAHERLKDPLTRAAYLCELAGMSVDAEDNTAMPAAFLGRQMEWREALDDAVSRADIDAIAEELERERRLGYQRLTALLGESPDYAGAVQEIRALMFVERFAVDVEDRVVALEQ